MKTSHSPHPPVDIVGRSCRLPGASNISEFWQLLHEGRCSVTQISPERFSMFRYRNDRRGEPGKAYTFAAGVLDNIWSFDPGVFNLSPREAIQMDPQQRLLLQLVFEALEDAGLPPVKLAGREVGVYVGNSGIDHNNRFMFDPAGSDSYMMTGNTGALISNRISYIFDLHGPSKTVDTACSSSLVALDEAVNALRSGQIDTAIVAGVNLMLSPFPFVGFSAASMLSPQGLCRPFDKEAYGYVRAEGGVVLVLQRGDDDSLETVRRHARIVETGVNSDGRTNGVALPSAAYQAELIKSVYARAGVDPEELAFVEAHGTGTRVGDPAEAEALGTILGQARTKALPIGSVKSNIGHLEPASGIASVLKAMLALEHDLFPATLHQSTPNPDIPFDDLNIKVCDKPQKLKSKGKARYAGISNFGFGGTNVHVLLTDAPQLKGEVSAPARTAGKSVQQAPSGMLMLSANCEDALRQLARSYAERIEQADDARRLEIFNATAWQRQRMNNRLVVFANAEAGVEQALKDFTAERAAANTVSDKALADNLDVALVYSGNGSQWSGMGRLAFEKNRDFSDCLKEIDRLFKPLSGWSLEQRLFADDLEEQLQSTEVAQPLLFALQVSLTRVLRQMGLNIEAVIGHSVGEVAAGWASGALSLKQAVKIIYYRSKHQESLRGRGLMLALMLPEAKAAEMLNAGDYRGVEISATNSARSITLSGPSDEIKRFTREAEQLGLPHKLLDIDYPFHNALLDPVEKPLIEDLKGIKAKRSSIPLYSTVTGKGLAGTKLNAKYWWDNIRQPVRFADAIESAAGKGCRLFLEIGPKAVLNGYIREITNGLEQSFAILPSLSPDDDDNRDTDPVTAIFARAIAAGAGFDPVTVFGKDHNAAVDLPTYPWQNKSYQLEPSTEALEAITTRIPPHPLLGQQLRGEEYVWTRTLDTSLYPFLADHKVDGKIILPGAGFAEMALAAASQWLDSPRLELRDMDIVQPLMLHDDQAMEVRTRLSVESGTVEIASRKRLSAEDWQTHIKCRIAKIPGDHKPELEAPSLRPADDPNTIVRLYELSSIHGMEFGPRFQRMIRCDEPENDLIEVVLDERDTSLDPMDGESQPYLLHPLDLDGCFHGLNILYDKLDLGTDRLAFIPIRLGRLRLYQPQVPVRTARINVLRSNRRGGQCDFSLFDAEGGLVATLHDARFRAAALTQRHLLERTSYTITDTLLPLPGETGKTAAPAYDEIIQLAEEAGERDGATLEEQRLLLDAASRRSAYDILVGLADGHGRIYMKSPSAPLNSSEEQERVSHRLAITSSLLMIAEQSAMVTPQDGYWQLSEQCQLPPVDDLLQLLLADDPSWSAECVLLKRASQLLPEILSGDSPTDDTTETGAATYSHALLEQQASSSPLAGAHIEHISELAGSIIRNWPAERPLRILQLGGGGLSKRLLPLVEQKRGHLLVVDSNKLEINRLQILMGESTAFEAVLADDGGRAIRDFGPFDLLLSANGLHQLANADDLVRASTSSLAANGTALLSVSAPDIFHDVVFGATENWFDTSIDPLFPLTPMKDVADWQKLLSQCGLDTVRQMKLRSGLQKAGLFVACRKAGAIAQGELNSETALPLGRQVLIATSDQSDEMAFSEELSAALVGSGLDEELFKSARANATSGNGSGLPHPHQKLLDRLTDHPSEEQVDLVYLAGAFDEEDAMSSLGGRVLDLTGLLQQLAGVRARLWVVAPGGARAYIGAGAPSPVQCGIWAFGRTATNEYADLDIRLIDFDDDLSANESASRLAELINMPGDETELVISRHVMRAFRLVRGQAPSISPTTTHAKSRKNKGRATANHTTILHHSTAGSIDRLAWRSGERRAPAPEEVEIEVVASGLNFRDVMWAQGLLPEEALEDGFAGPTLGFECAGRVIRLGEKVKNLQLNDHVMALAPACFASHVTTSALAVARLPKDIDLCAAASIPVTFLTAYYSLHHLAQLQEDEWVLIHGAAGGVGLAAVQIAKWKRAKVIATAGSDEKRQFLKMYGADHVLNTRTLDFVDKVREITETDDCDGVDVVLNSLSGEAMERSLELVRPFGRFLELGKRDFYGNSKIGLRPFRRNVSYFGIDADQLLSHQPKLSQRLMSELTELLAQGLLTPLPYRRFEHRDIVDAFRLMQQSGHLGKIIVKAPDVAASLPAIADREYDADPEGTHIIVGGLGGFGLEAALWLCERGARSIVLTSRSGKIGEQAQETLALLKRKGVTVKVERNDATNEDDLAELLERLRAEKPIKGIMHTAMVLNDALIHNITPQQVDEVLAPKVIGAGHLDRLTREDKLDYFMLFSSAAALFGNPGQAGYVAANAYLEGLALQRRAQGLPALAVGWGAITDVGILAREVKTAESLFRHTGGASFTARQALNLLSEVLVTDDGAPEHASIALAAMNWSFAGTTLPIMKKPMFSLMAREAAFGGQGSKENIDLHALVEDLDDEEAREQIARLLAEEVAIILRLPVEDINTKRSLEEIGMDSLMGMELQPAARQKLGIDLPMVALADGTTINDIASRVLERLRSETSSDGDPASLSEDMLTSHHGGDMLDTEQLEIIAGKIRHQEQQLDNPT